MVISHRSISPLAGPVSAARPEMIVAKAAGWLHSRSGIRAVAMRCVLLGMLLAGAVANRAGAQGSWYYCDALHAYYPYVATCPGDWRAVAPYDFRRSQQGQGTPAPQSAAPAWVAPMAPVPTTNPQTDVQPSAAYQEGQADRRTWEAWFASLSGDYQAGAEYWAGQRSLAHPGSCYSPPQLAGVDWTAGCLSAKQKLAPYDVMRKSSEEYRQGWNDPGQGALTTTTTTTNPTSNDAGQPDETNEPAPRSQYSTKSDNVPVKESNASQSPDSGIVPAQSQSGSDAWLIIFIIFGVITVGSIAIMVSNVRATERENRRRRDEVWRIVTVEIVNNFTALRVKRIQTVFRDKYGTVFLNKWAETKEYYVATKVIPVTEWTIPGSGVSGAVNSYRQSD